jgi:riboflavin synthase
MFTGIVEGTGKVVRSENRGEGKRLSLLLPPDLTGVQPGDSISTNGVCLTVVDKRGQIVDLDLSPETLQKTDLSEIREGDWVNVERALSWSGRLGGHIVTGHIDGAGMITEKRREKDFLHMGIRVPEAAVKYIVQKGSIAIDGISLTVNDLVNNEVRLMIIPFTLEKTTLSHKSVGDRVNVEADILGKYVERLLESAKGKSGKIDLAFLAEHGFIKGS